MLIRLTWELPAENAHVPLCRRTVRMLLEHGRVVEEDIDGIELIIGELCANVIRHAYKDPDGRYVVEVALDDMELRLSVTDSGCGFNQADLPPEPRFSEIGGMGFFLISHFADRFEFQAAEGGGSAITASRTLRRREEPSCADQTETGENASATSGRTPKLSR